MSSGTSMRAVIDGYVHDLPKIVEQLGLAYNETGMEHAGPIQNNVAFMALQEMAKEDPTGGEHVTVGSYQKYVRDGILDTAKVRGGYERLNHMALSLCGEAGELANLVKKINMGKPVSTDRLADELGDVMWYAMALAVTIGVDMKQVIKDNITKLNGRYSNEQSQQAYLSE